MGLYADLIPVFWRNFSPLADVLRVFICIAFNCQATMIRRVGHQIDHDLKRRERASTPIKTDRRKHAVFNFLCVAVGYVEKRLLLQES